MKRKRGSGKRERNRRVRGDLAVGKPRITIPGTTKPSGEPGQGRWRILSGKLVARRGASETRRPERSVD